MTMRTTNKTITFHQPFRLEGVDGVLPPADYRVVTDEEIIEGLSFVAYHRVATSIFVPAPFGSAVEMVSIDPADLEAAQAEDLIMHEMQPVDRVLLAPITLSDEADCVRAGQLGARRNSPHGFFWPPPWPGLARWSSESGEGAGGSFFLSCFGFFFSLLLRCCPLATSSSYRLCDSG